MNEITPENAVEIAKEYLATCPHEPRTNKDTLLDALVARVEELETDNVLCDKTLETWINAYNKIKQQHDAAMAILRQSDPDVLAYSGSIPTRALAALGADAKEEA